jgi:hypothetical protein
VLRHAARASSAPGLPRAEASPLLAALRRARAPLAGLTIAIPLDGSRVDATILRARMGPSIEVGSFPDWLVLEAREPLASPAAVVCRLRSALSAIRNALMPSAAARHELGLYLSVDETALRATDIRCGGR